MSWHGNEESLEERRARWRRRDAESDAAAGIETTADFTPFRQMDDVFTRAFRDERVRTQESDAFFHSYRADFTARRGVVKWTSDAEKCFGYWAKLASGCAICLRVCPINRDFRRWTNRLWLRLALSPLHRLALWLDDRSGRANRAAEPEDAAQCSRLVTAA